MDPLLELLLKVEDPAEKSDQASPRVRQEKRREREREENIERPAEKKPKRQSSDRAAADDVDESQERAAKEADRERKRQRLEDVRRQRKERMSRDQLWRARVSQATGVANRVSGGGSAANAAMSRGIGMAGSGLNTIRPGLASKLAPAAKVAGYAAAGYAVARGGASATNAVSGALTPGEGDYFGRETLRQFESFEAWVKSEIDSLKKAYDARQDMLLVGGDPAILPHRTAIATLDRKQAEYRNYIEGVQERIRNQKAKEQSEEAISSLGKLWNDGIESIINRFRGGTP